MYVILMLIRKAENGVRIAILCETKDVKTRLKRSG